MSTEWQGETGVMVTRYCGPADEGDRRRYSIHAERQSSTILTNDQAIELAILLIKATHNYRDSSDEREN